MPHSKPRITSVILDPGESCRPSPGKYWVLLNAFIGHTTGTTTYLRFFDPKTNTSLDLAVVDTGLNTGYYPCGIVRTVTSGAVTYLLQALTEARGTKLTNECYLDFLGGAAALAVLVFEEFDCSESGGK